GHLLSLDGGDDPGDDVELPRAGCAGRFWRGGPADGDADRRAEPRRARLPAARACLRPGDAMGGEASAAAAFRIGRIHITPGVWTQGTIMKFCIHLSTRIQDKRNELPLINLMTDLALKADAGGKFSAISLTEHHLHENQAYQNSLLFACALAPR